MLPLDIVERPRGHQTPADEGLVHDVPECVDVALDRHRAVREHLRRHVGERPFRDPITTDEVGGLIRDSEIHQLRLAGLVDHDVGRLQITMEHAARVNRRQSGAHPAEQLNSRGFHETPAGLEQVREIVTVDVFHREKGLSVGFPDVVDPADIRMRDLPREADLIVELRQTPLVACERRRETLERDAMREPRVVGAIDDAHSASSQDLLDAVTIVDDVGFSEGFDVGTGAGASKAGGCRLGEVEAGCRANHVGLGVGGRGRRGQRPAAERTESAALRRQVAALCTGHWPTLLAADVLGNT